MARYGLKHGMWNTRIYHVWQGMKQRCEDPKRENYKYYGARGISVCEEWHDPEVFIAWALSHGYKEGLSLDRIDNGRGYSPDNCRWADAKTQGRNQRSNHLVEYNGETRCLSEWSEIVGIPVPTIWRRLNKGMSAQDAFTTPPKKRTKNIENKPIIVEYGGVKRTLREWSEITGLSHQLLRTRINRGWKPERALTTPVQLKGNERVSENL